MAGFDVFKVNSIFGLLDCASRSWGDDRVVGGGGGGKCKAGAGQTRGSSPTSPPVNIFVFDATTPHFIALKGRPISF